MKAARRITILLLLCCLGAAPVEAQRGKKARGGDAFTQLSSRATAAREAGRFDEAIDLYRQAVRAQPRWEEGWWFLATLLYDRDDYAEAAEAFAVATKLQPKSGIASIMLGLCEYRLGRYDQAVEHIVQGRRLGFGQNDELSRVVLYHEGVLGTYRGEFEAAQHRLDNLAYLGVRSEQLVLALGLVVLRIPQLPEQIATDHPQYTLIRQAGWAEYQLAQNNVQDASREYDRLATEHPSYPNVQYAYGRYHLVQRNTEAALAAFHREIANSPNHAMARLQIAYIHLSMKEPEKGLEYAEEAVRLAPRFGHGRFLLGRLLYETGDHRRAVEQLETARELAPGEPKIYYTLARAYDRVDRKDDAKQARAIFAELSRRAEGTATDSSSPIGDTP